MLTSYASCPTTGQILKLSLAHGRAMMGSSLGMRVRAALRPASRTALRGQDHDSPPSSMPPAVNEEFQDLYKECLAKKANANIEPFLKMLYDNGLIDCETNPRKAKLETRIKIQKFAYLAQECFGLNFHYTHMLYIYGPYSVELANDYYRIQDIRDIPTSDSELWPGKEAFLEFAKQHNDVEWLEIAGVLAYLHNNDRVPVKDLVRYAEIMTYKFSRSYIEEALGALQVAGLFKGAE